MRKIITLLTTLFMINQGIRAQCNPAFTFSVNQSVVTFTGTTTAPGIFHYWRFGDGYIGWDRITSHNYNTPGTYQVYHIVYDSLNSCLDSLMQVVTVNFTPTCQASFYAQYDSVDYNYGIYCYSNSTYSGTGIQSYTWSVNGVVRQSNGSSFHFNPVAGVNNVCLTIVTNAGCTSGFCQSFTAPAACNLSPSFSYTADPVNRRRISFTPSVNQPAFRYHWSFGDGYTSTARMPVHTYAGTGTYPVKLVIRDTVSNCVDTVRQPVIVAPGDTCTASFTYTLNNYGLANFTASSNQPISSQSWFIYRYATGDSTLIQANNPSYQFPDTGYYYVCLMLTTHTGCMAWYCNNIYVGNVAGRFEETIRSYPNPANSGMISMNLIIGAAGPMDIKVFDITGMIVYQSQQQGGVGGNIVRIPVDKLNKGQYFVEICYRYKIKRSIFQKL